MADTPWSAPTLSSGYSLPAQGERRGPTLSGSYRLPGDDEGPTLSSGYTFPAQGERWAPTLSPGYNAPYNDDERPRHTPSTLASAYYAPPSDYERPRHTPSTLAAAYNAPPNDDERPRRTGSTLASRYKAAYDDDDDQGSHGVAFGKMKVNVWSDSLFRKIETTAFLDTGGEGESCNLISKSFLKNDLRKEFYDKSDAMSWPGAGGEVKTCGSVRLKIYPFRPDKRTGRHVEESPVMIKFYVYDHDEYPQWGDLNIGQDCLERNGWWWSLKLIKKLSEGNVIACTTLRDKC
jgi:hypothetical protein